MRSLLAACLSILPAIFGLWACSCSRSPEAAQHAPDAALVELPTATASASASTQLASRAPAALLRLEAREGDKKGKPTAWLVAPEIGFELLVTELPLPFVCKASPSESGGLVSCTPDPRRTRIELARGPQGLLLSGPRVPERMIASPDGGRVELAAGEVSARSLPALACPADAPARDANVEFLYHNDMDTGGYMRLLVPRGKPGDVRVVELWHERRGLGRCRSEGTVDERKLHCDDARDTCTIRSGIGSFSVQCDGPPPYEGVYLLPCGAKARLVTQGQMGRTESYY